MTKLLPREELSGKRPIVVSTVGNRSNEDRVSETKILTSKRPGQVSPPVLEVGRSAVREFWGHDLKKVIDRSYNDTVKS